MTGGTRMDSDEAERVYSVEGVDLAEAKRLKLEARESGWNAHVDYDADLGHYAVRVFGPRYWDDPGPAA